MTPELVYQWARDAGAFADIEWHKSGGSWHYLRDERFAALACAWQAEQDANLADKLKIGKPAHTADHPVNLYRGDVGDAIRASVKGGA